MSAWLADARFAASPDVLLSGEGAERFVTDLASGAVYQINESASLVFERARSGASLAGIEDALCAAYPDVPRDELARDARDLLGELVGRGILKPA